jgi:cytochrome c biogenesis protein CcmG/thiol:disulfide interchange protein DsbE
MHQINFTGSLRSLAAVLLMTLFFHMPVWGDSAPDFSLSDAQGNIVSLKDFNGQPLILHFWATWCPYCKKLQPGLERLVATEGNTEIVLLGISFREDEGVQPQAELAKRGHTFKTLINGEQAAQDYAVRGTPTTFFIARNGEIVGVTNTSNPEDPVLTQLAGEILK